MIEQLWYSLVMKNDWTEVYTKYKGLWVALLEDGNTVVGSGKTPEVALAKAEKKGHPDAYLMSVPQETFNFVG